MSGTRKYSSPRREADAANTRTRIVDAAATLFARDGYVATPLRAIAEEAGVSIQSVNLAGPKSALLLAAFERTFAGDEGQHSLLDRAEFVEIFAEPDPRAALERYVAFLTAANARAAGIWRALSAAADADDAARVAAEDLEARRRKDMAAGARRLAERGLIDGRRTEDAADVLGYLTSPQTYLYFVEETGWSRKRYSGWLARAIHLLVLGGDSPRS